MIIRVQCAWCRSDMGEVIFQDADARLPAVSHGICPECRRQVFGSEEKAPDPYPAGER